jgi:Galactose-3-O-sulfotransferase
MRPLDRLWRFAWRRKLRLEQALAERNAYLRQRDEAIGERNEILRQRDIALGERNEILRQRDEQIGLKNLLIGRSDRYGHRADVVTCPAAATGNQLLLFLHLAKTGGMTLADILTRNFASEEFLQIDMAEANASALGVWSPGTIEQALARLQPSEAARLRVVWGHYRHGVQALLPKSCAVVTLLRDPLDRIISAYYYSNKSVGSLEILEQYHVRKYYDIGFDNAMSRIISGGATLDPIAARQDATTENFPTVTESDFEAAAANLDGYLVVGTTEQFDETLLVLGRDLRWSLSDLLYTPVNVTASRPVQSNMSDALLEKILDWNRYDIRLVERGRAHLARRIAAYRGDFARDLLLFRELNSQFGRGVPLEELRRIERDAVIGDAIVSAKQVG